MNASHLPDITMIENEVSLARVLPFERVADPNQTIMDETHLQPVPPVR
jgi:hypothetical protein